MYFLPDEMLTPVRALSFTEKIRSKSKLFLFTRSFNLTLDSRTRLLTYSNKRIIGALTAHAIHITSFIQFASGTDETVTDTLNGLPLLNSSRRRS